MTGPAIQTPAKCFGINPGIFKDKATSITNDRISIDLLPLSGKIPVCGDW